MEKEDFEHLSIVTETTDTTAQRLFVNRKWQLP